jgi:hypothetical protein
LVHQIVDWPRRVVTREQAVEDIGLASSDRR